MPPAFGDEDSRPLSREHLFKKRDKGRRLKGIAVLRVGVLRRNIRCGDDLPPKERLGVVQSAPIAHAAVGSDKDRPLRPARLEICRHGRRNALAVNGEDEEQHGVLPKGLPQRQSRLSERFGAGKGDLLRMAAPGKITYVRHCSAPISSRIRAHSGNSSREKPRLSFISAMTSSFGRPQRLLAREISSALKGMSVLSQL